MSLWRRIGVAGGVTGVLAASAVAGVTAQRGRRRQGGPGETFPLLHTDRTTTVAADDGVPLVVQESGPADAPLTVVLVHGFCLSLDSWYFQRRDLAGRAGTRLVLYDQRSHGRSGASAASACTIDQLGRDLGAVLRTVAPTGPVVLVGHSMGGMTIMALARQQPALFDERVAGVALVSTAAGGLSASRVGLSTRNPVLEALRRLGGVRPDLLQRGRGPVDGLLAPVIRAMSYGDRDTPREVVEFSERLISETALQTVLDFVPTLSDHDELAALPRIAGRPIVVVCGDADRMTPFRHTAVIAEALAEAELVRVPGAGHLVMLEQPRTVSEAIERVLDRAGVPARG